MKIFVVGTGYSGTGFVLDWLREQPGAGVLPYRPFVYSIGGREWKLDQHVFPFLDAADRDEKRAIAQRVVDELSVFVRNAWKLRLQQAGKQAFARAKDWVRPLLGKAVINPEQKSREQGVREARHDKEWFSRLVDQCGNDGFEERALLREWIAEKIPASATESGVMAVDKSLPLTEVRHAERLLELAAPARVLVVVREPVDQFCDILRCDYPGREVSQVSDSLARKLDGKLAMLRVAQELAERHPDAVKFVTFENFVHRHGACATAVGDWLGFSPKVSGYRHLNLSQSAANIGLAEGAQGMRELVEGHEYAQLVSACAEQSLGR